MNKPNPLVPQGTFPDKGKAQIRITVFAILAIHVVLLGVLLIAGCNKKSTTETPVDNTGLPPIPPVETNAWPTPPPAQDVTTTTLPPPPVITQEVVTLAPTVIPTPVIDQPVITTLSEHTISKGESFYTLGKKYGVGYKAIADANPGVNPNRLKIGDKIKIPPPKAGVASFNGTVAPADDGGVKTYKVKSGDNLGKIAKAYGVTVKQLRAANNLRTDQIKVGQTLKIPVKEPAPLPPVESIPPVPAAPPAAPPGYAPPQ
jgi:LysM repeat protein